MAKSFLTSIQLNGNSLLNGRVDSRWSATPSGTTNPDGTGTAVAGQISSYNGALYVYSGSAWTALSTGAGTVTSVSGTTNQISSTGGTTPVLSLATAYGDTVNPYASKTANYVLASPNGSNGVPTFRAIVAADIPTLNQNTTGSAGSTTGTLTFGTGLTAAGASFNGSANVTITPVSATTSVAGIVQLSDSTSTTSSTLAATATAAKAAYDRGSTGVTNAATAQSTADSATTTANAALPKAGGTMSGAIAMGSNKITGLGTPTAAADAATKDYVDNVSTGINIHDAVVAATTGTIAGVYAAGSTTANPPGDGGTGVGATITYSATGTTTLDTSVTLAQFDRVLVKDGVTAAAGASSIANGVYVVTTAGTTGVATVLTRATDADNSHFGDLSAGDLVYVLGGNTHVGDQFVQTTKGTATQGTGADTTYSVKIGTDAISYTQFSGAGAVPNATTTTTGIASFPAAQFSVSSGAVTIDNLAGEKITSGTVADARIASALTGKTYNKVTITAPSVGSVLTIADTKTFVVNNSITLAGTDSTTMTFPGTSATIARTDAAQTFTGVQTFTSPSVTTSLTTASTTFTLLPSVQTAVVADVVSTLSLGAGTHASGTRTITIGTTSSSTGAGQTINLGANTQNSASNIINIGGSSSTATTITGSVLLPTVANSTAGFVKTATDGTLSRAAIAYADLPTNVGVVARKVSLVGTGSGTTIALTHGLGTNLVTAQVFDTSTSTATLVEVDITVTSTVATATFGATTTLSNYTLVVVG